MTNQQDNEGRWLTGEWVSPTEREVVKHNARGQIIGRYVCSQSSWDTLCANLNIDEQTIADLCTENEKLRQRAETAEQEREAAREYISEYPKKFPESRATYAQRAEAAEQQRDKAKQNAREWYRAKLDAEQRLAVVEAKAALADEIAQALTRPWVYIKGYGPEISPAWTARYNALAAQSASLRLAANAKEACQGITDMGEMCRLVIGHHGQHLAHFATADNAQLTTEGAPA